MAFIIIYLPTCERVRLFTSYTRNVLSGFTEQKDIFDSFEEASYILQDNRVLYFTKSWTKTQGVLTYLDCKCITPDHEMLVPKHLLEVIEV